MKRPAYDPLSLTKKRSLLKPILWVLLALFVMAVLTILAVPSLAQRATYQLDKISSDIKYFLNPPEKAVFVPQATVDSAVATAVRATLLAQVTTASVTPNPTATDAGPTGTPLPTLTPTLTPTEIPGKTILSGVTHEFEMWNNCGPATLAMNLSFWKWKGDQRDTAPFLKPNPRDKNVMAYEMEAYITEKTGFKALVRVGGTLDLLKQLIAAGYPVIVEKGFEVAAEPSLGWMGHYNLITGYDDARQRFIVQDSYIGDNLPVAYDDLLKNWRAFDYLFLVVYPPAQESDVMSVLGAYADPTASYQAAAQHASDETVALKDPRDLFFAWYNRATSLVYLQDYGGAAQAFDEAFSIYPAVKEGSRPWRMLWYQTGPYFAYFYSGRYQDVINLASQTLDVMSEPVLEESWYWRANARAALGDTSGAIADLRQALVLHTGFQPALALLGQLGAAP